MPTAGGGELAEVDRLLPLRGSSIETVLGQSLVVVVSPAVNYIMDCTLLSAHLQHQVPNHRFAPCSKKVQVQLQRADAQRKIKRSIS